ncbi:MAG: helix-turn-helix transcriptional regulator [Balneolaceae bacterium]|nr:helix-turn-helix transcriptional regulator [Balneolaceae bacterium]
MKKPESIKELYEYKFGSIPESLSKEIGHFNLFRVEPFKEGEVRTIPYRRRDYYKIMLIEGKSDIFYADRVVHVNKQALVFSNPMIPYKWDNFMAIKGGIYCIFDDEFFINQTQITEYSVYQPTGNHVFELTDAQVLDVISIFERMFNEIESDYVHKFDVLRNQVLELIHFAMKTESSLRMNKKNELNASSRIHMLFDDLLERQFPVDDVNKSIALKNASDFAHHLNVHTNHLNRALKEATGKTTSTLITERLLREAKTMLRNSTWNISEIAFSLGFKETTHFSNFFKKHLEQSPTEFRSH